jgi:hypothetical protein
MTGVLRINVRTKRAHESSDSKERCKFAVLMEMGGTVVDGVGSALPDVVAASGLSVLEVAHHKGHQVRGHLPQRFEF